jgi:glycosyltransferase involved in cell wall biosynthesis
MSSATDRPLGDPSMSVHKLFPHSRLGSAYKEGDTAFLQAALENYVSDPARLNQHSRNARQMAEALFDRETTYAVLARFIVP